MQEIKRISGTMFMNRKESDVQSLECVTGEKSETMGKETSNLVDVMVGICGYFPNDFLDSPLRRYSLSELKKPIS